MRAVSGWTCVAAIAAGLLVGCGDTAMDERTPVPQEATERVVAEGDFEIQDTLQADGPTFNPQLVRLLDDGDLLVYDAGSSRLLRYDSTGAVVTRYDSGPGSEPGQVVDIGVFDSGQIWSFDQEKNAVNVFDAAGSLNRRIALDETVHFLAENTDDRLIGINPANEQPFSFHGSDGGVVKTFGWLLDEPGMKSVPYVGRVMPLANGAIVYLMHSADIMKAYDAEGDLLWHRMLIDGFEPPGIYREGEASAYLEHPNGRSTITRVPLNTTNDRIHAFVVNSTAKIVYIDTYDSRDGSYVGSRRVPVTPDACMPQYIRGQTAWMTCIGGTLVRARIPEL